MGSKSSKVQPAVRPNVKLGSLDILSQYKAILAEWSGTTDGTVVYDSNVDSKLAREFYSSVLNKTNIYIINIDERGYIFGSYFEKVIDKMDVWFYDEKHFIFSLDSKGLFPAPTRWNSKLGEQGGIRLYDKDMNKLYEVGNGEFWSGVRFGYFTIADINVKNSFNNNISFRYDNIKNTDLNGLNSPNSTFSVERIIVVQMDQEPIPQTVSN
ncbi:hypothetical protein EIN_372000 [Entamoeba invadens IP1]|uniref:TLDc domain-containing protein n=1 Tax=Entamoeba invadens IP1 TaxID=370355 RepID=A0A0A1UCA8_ENTIV|nr:hypothetical protein EIN_372000 [Entamoeba invadens IP1]ELP92778.1 hypothetical protein EIN_372000 [Entamoeba invadens IP1]|eukprot:XP_004259549.1 hypothetical protein EIN_372000 [Entamoeba invadens IP1]